jgi:hypothetical protein
VENMFTEKADKIVHTLLFWIFMMNERKDAGRCTGSEMMETRGGKRGDLKGG